MVMDDEQEFTLGRTRYRTTPRQVIERLSGVEPEPIRKYAVEIGRHRYPVKQALAEGIGIDRAGFTSQDAYRILRNLGFEPAEARTI